jgi:A118 family predicted phage portal protein
MLFLDERMLEKDSAGNVVVPRERDQQLFRKTEMDTGSTQMIEDYNPDLRVDDNRLALRTGLTLLGQRCGMGAGYFDFDEASGLKTATEVISEQSDLFRSVRKHENALAVSIDAILTGVLSLARIVAGASIPEDTGTVDVVFDDSVIEDTGALRRRDLEDVAAQLMQPYEYRMRWYGEDEPTARRMVEGEPLPPEE